MKRFVKATDYFVPPKLEGSKNELTEKSELNELERRNLNGKETKKTNEEQWSCDSCTYLNHSQDGACVICHFTRKISSKVPMQVCSLCTFENAVEASECLMCGNRLEETKENRFNDLIKPTKLLQSSDIKANENISAPSSSLLKKSSTISIPISRQSLPNKSSLSNQDRLPQESQKVDHKLPSSMSYDGSDVSGEEDVYDYSEDDTYEQKESDEEDSSDSDNDSDSNSDSDCEDDLSEEKSVALSDGDILVSSDVEPFHRKEQIKDSRETRTMKSERMPKSPIIIKDDIDEFETSSDISISDIFSIKNKTVPSSSWKVHSNISDYLSNKPKEVRPTFPQVSSHYWSVKHLARKGVCALNFDDFTLDQGATNPNSAGLSVKSSRRKTALTTVDEIYEKKREKRSTGKQKSSEVKMRAQLQTNGSLVAATKQKKRSNTATETGGVERKPKKKKRRRSKKSASYGESREYGGAAPRVKRQKVASSSSRKGRSTAGSSSSNGWLSARVKSES